MAKKRNKNRIDSQAPPTKKAKPDQQQHQKQEQAKQQKQPARPKQPADLPTKPLLLPRDGRVVLLDVEGTTTSISFVKDSLFPYITEKVSGYLHDMIAKMNNDDESLSKLQLLLHGFKEDIKTHGVEDVYIGEEQDERDVSITKEDEPMDQDRLIQSITRLVQFLVKKDVKGKHLKDFQGEMWKCGYEQGKLHGHVYDDVLPAFQWLAQKGVYIYIYSSGSVKAQKLLFRYSTSGNLIKFLSGHFDINNAGPKREAGSYHNILDALKQPFKDSIHAEQIVFVSDVEQELEAAEQVGFKTVLSIRPGNTPCSEEAVKRFGQVHSLMQLCGGEEHQS